MPSKLLIKLEVNAQNPRAAVREKFDEIYDDDTKVLLIIIGDGPTDIEQNAKDAAGVNKSIRRAVWVKSSEILTKSEINSFTNNSQDNVVCSVSLSREVGSWRDAELASFYSEINLCFYEAEERG